MSTFSGLSPAEIMQRIAKARATYLDETEEKGTRIWALNLVGTFDQHIRLKTVTEAWDAATMAAHYALAEHIARVLTEQRERKARGLDDDAELDEEE